jgi:hypothetical protein
VLVSIYYHHRPIGFFKIRQKEEGEFHGFETIAKVLFHEYFWFGGLRISFGERPGSC